MYIYIYIHTYWLYTISHYVTCHILKKRTEEEAANVKRRENTLHGHERPARRPEAPLRRLE